MTNSTSYNLSYPVYDMKYQTQHTTIIITTVIITTVTLHDSQATWKLAYTESTVLTHHNPEANYTPSPPSPCTRAFMHARTHSRTHARTHARTHTHTHTHTYKHTRTHSGKKQSSITEPFFIYKTNIHVQFLLLPKRLPCLLNSICCIRYMLKNST